MESVFSAPESGPADQSVYVPRGSQALGIARGRTIDSRLLFSTVSLCGTCSGRPDSWERSRTR